MCNDGYYFKPNSTCLACPQVCTKCTSPTLCSACKTNREGNLCNCPANSIDYLSKNTLWCGTCKVAIVSIKFSDDWMMISIDFGFEVALN